MKPISTWLVWTANAILWILALALWVGIFTSLMIAIAEYEYPIATISRDYYEQ